MKLLLRLLLFICAVFASHSYATTTAAIYGYDADTIEHSHDKLNNDGILNFHYCCGESSTSDLQEKTRGGSFLALVDDFVVPKGTLTRIDSPQDLVGSRRDHILNRHRSNAGKSGKTEFPSNWNDDRIIHQVSDIATDPKAVRGVGKWDSPYAISTRDGVEIRVDFYPDRLPSGQPHPNAGKISTAYPTNTLVNPWYKLK